MGTGSLLSFSFSDTHTLSQSLSPSSLSRLCPIFRLGDIVRMAGGDITRLAVKGGVIGIGIYSRMHVTQGPLDICREGRQLTHF